MEYAGPLAWVHKQTYLRDHARQTLAQQRSGKAFIGMQAGKSWNMMDDSFVALRTSKRSSHSVSHGAVDLQCCEEDFPPELYFVRLAGNVKALLHLAEVPHQVIRSACVIRSEERLFLQLPSSPQTPEGWDPRPPRLFPSCASILLCLLQTCYQCSCC